MITNEREKAICKNIPQEILRDLCFVIYVLYVKVVGMTLGVKLIHITTGKQRNGNMITKARAMKKKIINLLDDLFNWIDEKNVHIGNLEFCTWVVHSQEKRKREIDFAPDCGDCYFGWDCMSYEDECEDCGCYINHEFNTLKFFCALP